MINSEYVNNIDILNTRERALRIQRWHMGKLAAYISIYKFCIGKTGSI